MLRALFGGFFLEICDRKRTCIYCVSAAMAPPRFPALAGPIKAGSLEMLAHLYSCQVLCAKLGAELHLP